MTPEDVIVRVGEIEADREDDERAHGMEDNLWHDVLRAIAEGLADDPRALAKEALKTTEIAFARWTA